MSLPRKLVDWPPEALEEMRERSAIIWEGDRSSRESDWPAAQAAAERVVRARWQRAAAPL